VLPLAELTTLLFMHHLVNSEDKPVMEIQDYTWGLKGTIMYNKYL